MSKQELQQRALKNSGVSYDESLEATSCAPCMFERLGGEEGCKELSTLFYTNVFASGEDWFLNIFSSSTKQEAIDNQYRFFVQTFGGPDLYKQKKGKYTRLVGRHANYNIGTKAAQRWVEHMLAAIQEHSHLKSDNESRAILEKYFNYTAHYIVAGMTYMRSDQVCVLLRIENTKSFIGCVYLTSRCLLRLRCRASSQLSGGTQIDSDRIW